MAKKKKRPSFYIPWWKKKVYKGTDKTAYYLAVCDYLENGEVDESKTLKAGRMRVHL